MIPQSFIDDLQSRANITELISEFIPLKRAGRNFKGLCPFHSEKTPSFIVSPQKQIFHCFGCGEGGGIIQFLILYEKVNFVEAVEILAHRVGLTIPQSQGERGRSKNTLYEAAYEASLFFQRNLLGERSGSFVLSYLKQRGIDNEGIKQFRIGVAFGNNTLLKFMRQKGFSINELEKASLIVSHREGYSDLFRQRITFPIFDVRSRVIGFGGRALKESPHSPKYINSPESPLYSKREHLFGLNFSKEDIGKKDCAIVVEGYLDMIVPFLSGIKNVVASLGTSLTLEQIHLIRRFTSNVVLVFDSDKAGEIATLRSLDLLLENDLTVHIVKLPTGDDPDSLVRKKGKDFFLQIVSEKQDFFDYKFDILKNIYDVESIEGKTKITAEILSTLGKLKSEVSRFEYIKKLSGVIKVKEEILIAEYRNIFAHKKSPLKTKPFFKAHTRDKQQTEKNSFLNEPIQIAEKVILKFMFTSPQAFSLIRKNVRKEDFTHHLSRKTIAYFFENDLFHDPHFSTLLGNIKDQEISSFVSFILMDENIPLDKELFKSSLQKIRQERIKNLKKSLKEQIRRAESSGDREKLFSLIGKYRKMNSEGKNG